MLFPETNYPQVSFLVKLQKSKNPLLQIICYIIFKLIIVVIEKSLLLILIPISHKTLLFAIVNCFALILLGFLAIKLGLWQMMLIFP